MKNGANPSVVNFLSKLSPLQLAINRHAGEQKQKSLRDKTNKRLT